VFCGPSVVSSTTHAKPAWTPVPRTVPGLALEQSPRDLA
jgi:hypothetical protein